MHVHGRPQRGVVMYMQPQVARTALVQHGRPLEMSGSIALCVLWQVREDGSSHGVMMMNSNAMDVILEPETITYR